MQHNRADHLCECGCGKPTSLAQKNDRSRGRVKGQPLRFVFNHHVKNVRAMVDAVRNKRPNLIGQQFGRLTVVEFLGMDGTKGASWRCKCSCGNDKVATTAALHRRSAPTRSCGCLGLEVNSKTPLTHGHTSKGHPSPTYVSWQGMVRRCTNPNHIAYQLYGGAGVKVAPEWMTFEGFLNSMGTRPEGTTLSRYGDVGNYEPGNVIWGTKKQQGIERSKKLAALGMAA